MAASFFMKKMELHYVYILYSKQFDKYYTGQTNDLENRLFEHNTQDKNAFTSKFRPWEIAATICFTTRFDAMQAERFIKKQKSRVFLQKIIDNKDNSRA
jgi:putative endonuclease